MIKIHFSRPQRGASGGPPLAVRRIGRVLFMALQIPEKGPRELVVPFGEGRSWRAGHSEKRGHGEVFFRRGARPALNGRVVRISGAGCSQDRRPAGDQRICHHHLGSGRRRFTIAKVWPAAARGEPDHGHVDFRTRGAQPNGISSP